VVYAEVVEKTVLEEMFPFVTGMEKCRCGKILEKAARREKSIYLQNASITPMMPKCGNMLQFGDIFKEDELEGVYKTTERKELDQRLLCQLRLQEQLNLIMRSY